MRLENPFTQETRLLYLYEYACMDCGRSDRGLELHHLCGRVSSSPLNAALLCKHCHEHVLYTPDEQRRLFLINYRFLVTKHQYQTTPEDIAFLERFPYLIAPAQSTGGH